MGLWIEEAGRKDWMNVCDINQREAAMNLHEDCLCLLEDRERLQARAADLEDVLRKVLSNPYCGHVRLITPALERTEAQSIDHIEARLLRDLDNRIFNAECETVGDCQFLIRLIACEKEQASQAQQANP